MTTGNERLKQDTGKLNEEAIEGFLQMLAEEAIRGPKGRRLREEGSDLLQQTFLEFWESLSEEQRAAFDLNHLPPVYRDMMRMFLERIKARIYARVIRRPASHPLSEFDLSDPASSRSSNLPSTPNERLRMAVKRLPKELRIVLMTTLEYRRLTGKDKVAKLVMAALGIGRSTYHERMKRAMAAVERLLTQSNDL